MRTKMLYAEDDGIGSGLENSLFCSETVTDDDRRMSFPPLVSDSIRMDLSLEVLDKRVTEIVQCMEERLNQITTLNRQAYHDRLSRDHSQDALEWFTREIDSLMRALDDTEAKTIDETELLGALARANQEKK